MRRNVFHAAAALLCAVAATASAQNAAVQYPILFVTQYPVTSDFTTIGSVFGNHRADVAGSGRGGDLYILYPSGTLRNLTSEAGFGVTGFQGATSISVRDPAVSWDGTKAVFSMAIGAPTQQFVWGTYYWQLYEVTGLGEGQTVSITKVPNQPANYNNVQPVYLSDGTLAFASDRPRNGAAHLYPQLDEYEEAPTATGLWHIAANGRLELLQHSVSGAFTPTVDSYGRLLFTRWDHMQRDQQNDSPTNDSKTFNYTSEASNSTPTLDRSEVFPEPRADAGSVYGFTINHFFPWMINQDGSEEETLNHIGRHELHGYFNRSFNNDAALVEFNPGSRTNPRSIENTLYVREDPTQAGRYYAVDAPEFYTHGSGQVIRFTAGPAVNPADMVVDYLTARSTVNTYPGTPPGDFTGHYRNPVPLSDGRVLVAHTTAANVAGNDGTRAAPIPRYQFRLKLFNPATGTLVLTQNLLGAAITKNVSFYDPDVLVSYNGPMWELSPVEVRARSVPPSTAFAIKAPEQNAFTLENVDVTAFRDWMRRNGLALIVMRNVTSRDKADQQQPYNLRVPGGVQTTQLPLPQNTTIYDISYMQFFQGDQIRGLGYAAPGDVPGDGRRMLAQTLHDSPAVHANPPTATPAGSAPIFSDGSVALFVPAQRPLAWHSAAPNGTPVVRERYWITFQPGEIRACDGCHGVNKQNQANAPAATNTALALRDLLGRWRDRTLDQIFVNGNEERR